MDVTSCFNTKYTEKHSTTPLLLVLMLGLILALSGCSSGGAKRTNTDLNPINSHSQNSNQACSNRYRVVSGDSLSVISARCNIRMSAIAKANNLYKPYTIRVGQILTLPSSKNSGVKQRSQAAQNRPHLDTPSRNEVDRSYQTANWQWPMQSKLEHRFIRDSSGLSGLEINCFPGMAVLAVAEGEVVYVGSSIMEFGLMVMIKHTTGHISVYAHNSQVHVKEGANVKAGQHIASSGATGLTERPKVYIEARYKGKKVDIERLF